MVRIRKAPLSVTASKQRRYLFSADGHGSSRKGHLQVAAGVLLQVAYDAKQVSCLWIPSWAEHADQALWLRSRRLAEFLKSNRRLDIVAQDRLSGVDITRQQGLDTVAQQGLGKSRVSCDMLLHQFLEALGRHTHLHSPLAALALPVGLP